MKNKLSKKNLIIIIIIILVLVASALLLILRNNGKESKLDEKELNLKNALTQFLLASGEEETSIKNLKDKKYFVDDSFDVCEIVSIKNDELQYLGKDCDKAQSYTNKPLIIVYPKEDFVINGWTNKGGEVGYSIITSEKSDYKTENIEYLSAIIDDTEIKNFRKLVFPKENTNSDVKLVVHYKDGVEYSKTFKAMIDTEAPKLVKKELNQVDYLVEYTDNSKAISGIYYGLTDDDEKPNKDSMELEPAPSLNCGTKYNVWTYAKDVAGNESDIELAGSFTFTCN